MSINFPQFGFSAQQHFERDGKKTGSQGRVMPEIAGPLPMACAMKPGPLYSGNWLVPDLTPAILLCVFREKSLPVGKRYPAISSLILKMRRHMDVFGLMEMIL